jgi:hypothetical protein
MVTGYVPAGVEELVLTVKVAEPELLIDVTLQLADASGTWLTSAFKEMFPEYARGIALRT